MPSSPSAPVALNATSAAPAAIADVGWRRRAFLIAGLGYIYIVAVGLGAAALVPTAAQLAATHGRDANWLARSTVHVGALTLAYAAVWVAWSTLRGFFLPRTPVEGVELEPGAAAPLRELIADLAGRLKVTPPTTVAITYDGASWLSIKTHESGRRAAGIYIGIATVLALPPEQFSATLAHELAHLRTDDARLTCFIERALERWCAYAVRFTQRRKFGALPLAIVSQWFISQLSEPFARLSRSDELDADRTAARCTDRVALATALERLAVESLRAEEVLWPALEREALAGSPIPDDYCRRWKTHFDSSVGDVEWTAWQRSAVHQRAADTDSHPTLAQRLNALGVQPTQLSRSVGDSISLFGEDWYEVRERIDAAWKRANEDHWAIAMDRGMELRSRLARAEPPDSNPRTILARALALMELGERAQAVELLGALVDREPEMDEARFHLACLLLADGNEDGVRHIDAVIEANESLRIPAVCHAIDFMIRTGRFDDADAYQCVIEASAEIIEAAQREREVLSVDDVFTTHELDAAYVSRIRELLVSIPQVRAAYLLRKQLHYELGDRLYILALDAPQSAWRASLDDVELRELISGSLILPGEFEIAMISGWEQWLRPHVSAIPDAHIYQKDQMPLGPI